MDDLLPTNELAHVEHFCCVEPNREMHEALAAIPNVTVYSSVAELDGLEITFDVVVAIHVLDHVPDLNQFTKQMTAKLSTGGICFVVVHNERSVLARMLGKRWPAFCLQHPHLFNQKTLFLGFVSKDLSIFLSNAQKTTFLLATFWSIYARSC